MKAASPPISLIRCRIAVIVSQGDAHGRRGCAVGEDRGKPRLPATLQISAPSTSKFRWGSAVPRLSSHLGSSPLPLPLPLPPVRLDMPRAERMPLVQHSSTISPNALNVEARAGCTKDDRSCTILSITDYISVHMRSSMSKAFMGFLVLCTRIVDAFQHCGRFGLKA
jgi:hypothetical protein